MPAAIAGVDNTVHVLSDSASSPTNQLAFYDHYTGQPALAGTSI